jgi:hypothetical protein
VGGKQGSRLRGATVRGHSFNVNELVQVKKLAEQLGGTARVKEVAAALERLV